ncbi:hypothetical protein C8R46DRAFT_1211057 [Mycena filopes]|nr:hypothetical protein C8R46DRAFT_1211057 [Mycena filopes]
MTALRHPAPGVSQPKLRHGSSPRYATATSSAVNRATNSQSKTIVARREEEEKPRRPTLQYTSPTRTAVADKISRRPGPADPVVNRNSEGYPNIPFSPQDGLREGVAMGLAFYQEGMLMKQSSIQFCLPPELRHVRLLPFIFRWPGYMHIRVKKDVILIDPETNCHITYAGLAQAVSEIFSTFIQTFGDAFDGSGTGVKLGPKAVTFHNLRIHQVYIEERTLQAEVSYTRRH